MAKAKGKAKPKGNVEVDVKTSSPKEDTPRGQPKSGRFWKTQKDRTTTMVKSRKKVGPAKLKALREDKERVKQMSTAIIEARKTEAQDKRRREEENKKKKEENSKKSEIVQVIKNTAKLKRMKKKALRRVEKRDTTVVKKDKKPPTKAPATAATDMETS